MPEIKFTDEELQLNIQLVDSVSVQGIEGMKKVLALSEKLKKAIKKSALR